MTSKPIFDALLAEVCVELGFCGSIVDGKPLHIEMFMPKEGVLSANDFARCVLQAEDMDSDGEAGQRHAEALRQAFIRHMGQSEVDVRFLS